MSILSLIKGRQDEPPSPRLDDPLRQHMAQRDAIDAEIARLSSPGELVRECKRELASIEKELSLFDATVASEIEAWTQGPGSAQPPSRVSERRRIEDRLDAANDALAQATKAESIAQPKLDAEIAKLSEWAAALPAILGEAAQPKLVALAQHNRELLAELIEVDAFLHGMTIELARKGCFSTSAWLKSLAQTAGSDLAQARERGAVKAKEWLEALLEQAANAAKGDKL